jgi:DNA-binding transcriptional MerR regulator
MHEKNVDSVQFDLADVHKRTGISTRKLRYCLDHGLIPGMELRMAVNESGRLRKFNEIFGFMLICVVKLLEIGLPHQKIRLFMDGLCEIFGTYDPKQIATEAILNKDRQVHAYFGDGMNMRVVVDQRRYDSGWIAPNNPAKLDASYAPTWMVTLDLGKVRDELWHLPPPATARPSS